MPNEEQRAKKSDSDTFDPNRSAVWPTYPQGTRLPVPEWQHSRRNRVIFDLVMLVVFAAFVAAVWWFLATVTK
jgi:hypothetical protein